VISFDIQRAKGASDVTVYPRADRRSSNQLEKNNPKVKFELLNNNGANMPSSNIIRRWKR
jgi:hypothetical protein